MPEDTEHTNTFIAAIQEMEDGGIVSDLDKRLREVVQEARNTGKKGSLSLKLEIEPRGAESVIVTADIGQKLPKADKPVSIFFVGEGGELTRDHPKQTTLPFTATKAAQP